MEIEATIKEYYNALPPEVKEAIQAVDLGQKVRQIANENKLHIDQSGALQTEVMLAMLGIEETENFTNNIQSNLAISKDLALKITREVGEKIFDGIRFHLQQLHKKEVGDTLTANNMPPKEGEGEHEQISREDVLRGIENPEPVQKTPPTISDAAPAQTENNPVKDDILQGIEEPQIYPAKIAEPASSLVGKKLNAITTLPKEEVTKEEGNSRYKVDPYREPLM
jgi:hypothetical protein